MNTEKIILDKKILAGKPIVKGTRISVEFIIELLGNGWIYDKILKNYPQLKKTDIVAALKYPFELHKEEKIYSIQ